MGGNLDVICKLIGTPFESVKEFVHQYSGDGIIWYFESCEMNTADIYTTLWQMKMSGWFKHSSGFLIGRPEGCEDVGDFTFADSLSYPLADLNVPVIYDCDIGHLPPQITLINGALASVAFKNGRCSIVQKMV
jgi:muramoyltetrapeptide carboxypeptidase LdcA involved in peptidoglycan recycling